MSLENLSNVLSGRSARERDSFVNWMHHLHAQSVSSITAQRPAH